tara:strand:- start:10325 stop:11299 length:975 start_codon:yes stop_codon:yes gene_type:complete
MVTVEEERSETFFDEELGEGCPDCGSTMICPSCSPEALSAVNQDLKEMAREANPQVARFLVDGFYTAQKNRIRAGNQAKQAGDENEPSALLLWNRKNFQYIENQIFKVLDEFSNGQELGRWARSICGIGPTLTAGLLAHIDLEKAQTPAGIWRFAGLDPTVVWNKSEKRPWNAQLKTLCHKIGLSFEKVQNNPNDFYGHMLAKRKQYEITNNEAGKYAETAKEILATGSYKRETVAKTAYEAGKLPDGQIRMRALRWAEKLFLSHYWHVGYEIRSNKKPDLRQSPPKPWVIAIGGHQEFIAPPNWGQGSLEEHTYTEEYWKNRK